MPNIYDCLQFCDPRRLFLLSFLGLIWPIEVLFSASWSSGIIIFPCSSSGGGGATLILAMLSHSPRSFPFLM